MRNTKKPAGASKEAGLYLPALIFPKALNGLAQPLKSTLSQEGILLPMAAAPKPAPTAPASYEAALEELEQLLARLESGDMPLAQLLTQYQRGAELLKFCRDQLEAVEGQIKVLDQGGLKTWTPE